MIRALFRKQMLEVFSWLYKDKKSGKRRTAKGVLTVAVLYLLLFGSLGAVFGAMAAGMCGSLWDSGMGWLYWCIMGLVAIFLGVFGSVFNAYSTLYQAKDNDLLLSMPIPTVYILLTRLSGVYAMGLMYELIVMVPTAVVWLVTVPLSLARVVNTLLIPLVLSLVVLVLSAILGWVIALVMTRVKRKNFVTVALSLAFIVGYYYVYGKAYSLVQSLLTNAAAYGEKLRSVLYPLYHMGQAAQGNMLSMLVFFAMVAVVTGIVFLLLSRNFLKLATANRGSGKNMYKERAAKTSSVGSALLRKELLRFSGSANYMLNCGLGILLMPLAAVLLVWRAGELTPYFSLISGEELALAAMAALCVMVSMNDITAPSISLEGKNLWILQSFPVSGAQVLGAKLKAHLLLTLIPALVPVAAVLWVLRPEGAYCVAMVLITGLFALLMACVGLVSNLLLPNFNWSSEVVPIKQGAPTLITIFGGWLIVLVLGGVYLLLRQHTAPQSYLIVVMVLLALADGLLLRWLMGTGAKRFEGLG